MKLTLTRVLTPLAALAIAFSAQATLPANDGFEEGFAPNQNGWVFVEGSDGVGDASEVVEYGADAKPADTLVGEDKYGLPTGFTDDGDYYLKLSTEDGILFRNVNGGENLSIPGTGLYLDTVVQFTVTDKNDRPTPTADDRFIIWLEAGTDSEGGPATNLCVYAGQYNPDGDGADEYGFTTNVYFQSTDIRPGSWHRLTVKAIADMFSDSEIDRAGFQIYIDGELLEDLSAENGGVDQSSESVTFTENTLPSMITGANLKQVGFSGEGKLDDVVITTSVPNVVPHDEVTITWADDKIASIKPMIGESEIGTFTSSPATFNVPAGATVTLATSDIAAAGSYNNAYFEFNTGTAATDDGTLTIAEDNKSLALAFSAADETSVLTLALDYTLAYNVTVDWSKIDLELLDKVAKITINETEISGDGLIDESSYAVTALKPGDSFTVEVNYESGSTLETVYELTSTPTGGLERDGTTFTIPASYEQSGEVTLTVFLSAITPAKKVFSFDGVDYTFAEAIAALGNGTITTTSENMLTLTESIDLSAEEYADLDSKQITIAEETEVWIDLAGKTLTGDDEINGYLFTVNGTLNITNSVGEGAIEADSGIATVSGTLNLWGCTTTCTNSYTGAITGGKDKVNVYGGLFSTNVEATFPTGYGLIYDTLYENYPYGAKTYTITYDENGGTFVEAMADTKFTIEKAGTISANTYTAPSGKKFSGWNTAKDGTGTAYVDGDATPAVTAELAATTTLYAQWEDDTIAVTGVTLDITSTNVTVGASFTLVATVTPDNATDKTVTWTSSDEDVATVEDGEVTAVAAGNVTITATAGGKSATCAITVSEKPSIDDGQGEIKIDEKTGNITVVPAEDTSEVDLSNVPAEATVTIPTSVTKITGVEATQVQITYTAPDAGATPYNITGAFTMNGDATEGVTYELNPEGSVDVDGETVPVTPTAGSVESTEGTIADGAVATKAIPGLTYTLKRGTVLGTYDTTADSEVAKSGSVSLKDGTNDKPADKAFYVIEVTK